ncbi:MAG TPA: patatin-like phospholipase family protein [Pyrinomonadaceae bacterium]|nr:patatin-like phospholipase family protein [Pyrinomonadaceae bacterium]
MTAEAPAVRSASKHEPGERLKLSQVLADEFTNLHHKFEFAPPATPPRNEAEERKEEDGRRKAIYKAIHELEEKRWALCLSGGGIRSATFCLGVLQGLARTRLLGRFDYLSTVSGGGYIGSWLTAWIHRDGICKVLYELAWNQNSTLPPEHAPILHLRSYSNYLSPKIGLFSVDTWTLVAIYLRNLFLNWLMFIPLLMAVLLLPRIYTSLILRNFWPGSGKPGDFNPGIDDSIAGHTFSLLVTGMVLAAMALAYIVAHRPSLRKPPRSREEALETPYDADTQRNFLWCCMILLTVAIGLLTIGRAWSLMAGNSLNSLQFVSGGMVLHGAAWLLAPIAVSLFFGSQVFRRYRRDVKSRLIELVVFVATGGLGGLLLWLLSIPEKIRRISPLESPELYACFDGPQLLLVFHLMGILSVGLAGRSMTDEDREWWARAGAWVLIVAVLWAALNSLVLYGPMWLEQILLNRGTNSLLPGAIAKWVLITFGIISGFVTILFGVSAKTPANERQAEKAGRLTTVMDFALKLAAPVFVLSLVVALSLFTDLLILLIENVPGWYRLTSIDCWKTADCWPYAFPAFSHHDIITGSSFLFLVCLFVVLLVIACVVASCVSVNEFSLHSMYRNRLIRAYLGASRKQPCGCAEHPCPHASDPAARRPNPFTGFDPADDLRMFELWPNPPSGKQPRHACAHKPLHIVNMTWNMVQGKNLAWQQRKAATFTVSPLHCGSYLYEYRPSKYYGGEHPESISLGTAFTISGAAASPNMGYYSSSAITFLMTLFNARLGWWLGNPVKDCYRKSGPKVALKPMVDEALGKTDADKDYIYLSDGGHFENLGLYEMVLRRSHTIFVIDASSDPDHKFENLGNAIRRIRVDLGVPIEIKNIINYSKEQDAPRTYCAIGDIHYKQVDEGEETDDGVLIYIKPMLTKEEPPDVFNYAKANLTFPHESISDQFFSEQQFESYRVLGLHAIEQIFQKPLPSDWDSGGLRKYILEYLNGFESAEPSKPK